MGKKYYGGIGTDKGFVMHSSESKYHYSRDDEFHKEGDKRETSAAPATLVAATAAATKALTKAPTKAPAASRATSTHLTTTIATTATTSWTTSSGTSYPLKPASRSQLKACSRRSCHAR